MILRATGNRAARHHRYRRPHPVVARRSPTCRDDDAFNPAILVNGDLSLTATAGGQRTEGNVHANGDITGDTAKAGISAGDVTATGDQSTTVSIRLA